MKATGDKGDTGEKGETGLIPYIGDNGNWWLGDADTGVQASVKGDTGEAGSDGKDGAKGDAGVSGTDGKNGADGIGIDKININENGELIINLTNGTAINLGKVTGDDGKDGEDGLTPYIGDNVTGGSGTKIRAYRLKLRKYREFTCNYYHWRSGRVGTSGLYCIVSYLV